MKMNTFRGPLAAAALLGVALVTPDAALAYIGPGAGISLLGALWALIAAVFAALAFVVLWPIRRAMKRRRDQRANEQAADVHSPTADGKGS